MQRSILLIAILAIGVFSACSSSGDSADSNAQNSNQAAAPLPQYGDADTALADGNKYLDEGETDKALDALTQAVKLNPDLAEAWFKLGIAYALAEKRDETLGVANDSDSSTSSKSPAPKPNSVKAFEKA